MLLPTSFNDFDFNVAGFSSTTASTPPLFLVLLSAFFSLVLFIFVRTSIAAFAWYNRPPIQLSFDGHCEALSSSTKAPMVTPPSVILGAKEKREDGLSNADRVPVNSMEPSFVQKPPRIRRWFTAFLPTKQTLSQFSMSMPISLSSLSTETRAAKPLGRGVGVVEGGMRTSTTSANPSPTLVAKDGRMRLWKTPTAGPTFEPPVPAIYQTEVPASMAKIILSRHTFRKPAPGTPRRIPPPSSLPRNVIA